VILNVPPPLPRQHLRRPSLVCASPTFFFFLLRPLPPIFASNPCSTPYRPPSRRSRRLSPPQTPRFPTSRRSLVRVEFRRPLEKLKQQHSLLFFTSSPFLPPFPPFLSPPPSTMSSCPHEAEPSNIILWCHPRSASTMFECAMLTRQADFEVLHEPCVHLYASAAPRFPSFLVKVLTLDSPFRTALVRRGTTRRSA
jgi:hypothetical protein